MHLADRAHMALRPHRSFVRSSFLPCWMILAALAGCAMETELEDGRARIDPDDPEASVAHAALARWEMSLLAERCAQATAAKKQDLVCTQVLPQSDVVLNLGLPLVESDVPQGIAFRSDVFHIRLSVDRWFGLDAFEDPVYALGILTRELRTIDELVLDGLRGMGGRPLFDASAQRYQTQARVYLLAPYTATPSYQASVTKLLTAYRSAPSGAAWNRYVEEQEGYDLRLLQEIQTLLQQGPSVSDPTAFLMSKALPVFQRAQAKLESAARDTAVDEPARERARAALRTIRSLHDLMVGLDAILGIRLEGPALETARGAIEQSNAALEGFRSDILARLPDLEESAPRSLGESALSSVGMANLTRFAGWLQERGMDPMLALRVLPEAARCREPGSGGIAPMPWEDASTDVLSRRECAPAAAPPGN